VKELSNPRFWVTVAAVYAAAQLCGFLIHQVLLADTYQQLAHVWRPEADMQAKMWIMFLTSAVWSALFVWIFAQGRAGGDLAEGLRYGLVIGVFYSITQAYDSYVIYPITYGLALTWFLSGVLCSVLYGVITAALYRPAGK
jgi:hypothetical protein